jgi:hypothetical protein
VAARVEDLQRRDVAVEHERLVRRLRFSHCHIPFPKKQKRCSFRPQLPPFR